MKNVRKYLLNNLEYSGNSFNKNFGTTQNVVIHIKSQPRNPNCEFDRKQL